MFSYELLEEHKDILPYLMDPFVKDFYYLEHYPLLPLLTSSGWKNNIADQLVGHAKYLRMCCHTFTDLSFVQGQQHTTSHSVSSKSRILWERVGTVAPLPNQEFLSFLKSTVHFQLHSRDISLPEEEEVTPETTQGSVNFTHVADLSNWSLQLKQDESLCDSTIDHLGAELPLIMLTGQRLGDTTWHVHHSLVIKGVDQSFIDRTRARLLDFNSHKVGGDDHYGWDFASAAHSSS